MNDQINTYTRSWQNLKENERRTTDVIPFYEREKAGTMELTIALSKTSLINASNNKKIKKIPLLSPLTRMTTNMTTFDALLRILLPNTENVSPVKRKWRKG